ncbi:MAG: type I restriction endonuclease subunit R, partial [Bacilli bacterium]|nr:type I restriction endonuclease subunit R [Bacilli bacterium]
LQFVRRYGFVTNICRIDDKELFKEYLFVSYLIHLLPKTRVDPLELGDKIRLQYFKLEEEYSGKIVLEKQDTGFVPANPKKPTSRIKKKDTLERIIEKVNLENEGNFGEGDKVALESVFRMMMDDNVVKTRLAEFAKTNDAGMFINSIFPGEFQRVLVQCFMQNDEAFQRLLGDEAFQKLVMDTMAKEFYRKLTTPDED